jgi:hypothetical protein
MVLHELACLANHLVDESLRALGVTISSKVLKYNQ